MDSLKKLIEEKKPTNPYKPIEESSKSHVNNYRKDLGLIDSPLTKRGGAPTGTIQKVMLADKRYVNLPTVAQLKAQDYFSRRQRPKAPIAQNPDLGGAIKTEEDQYGQSHSLLDEEQQNPLVGGTERAEDETLQAIQDGAGHSLTEEYEQRLREISLPTGQPPAKIANPRGQSGSSGVYRTTVGKSELWENRPQHQGNSIEAILQSTQNEMIGSIPRGSLTRSEFDRRVPLGKGNLVKSFKKAVEVDRIAQLLEHYNFVQQEATSAYGVSETTYQHRDGRSVVIGQETDGQSPPVATTITVGDQGSTYPINSIPELDDFVALGKLPVAPKSFSKPGISHTVIDSKWENQDEIGLGNVTRPQVEGRDKVTPSFSYTEFVQIPKKKANDTREKGHSLVKSQIEKWQKDRS